MKADEAIKGFLEQGVEDGVFAGAQAAWCVDNGPVEVAVAGMTSVIGGAAVESHTCFDISSLTKLFVASAALRLVDRGNLSLDMRLDVLVPISNRERLACATLAQILSHEAGFPAWQPFFERLPLSERGTSAARDAIIEMSIGIEGRSRPGDEMVYSDIGFIVLGHLLERISGLPLDDLVSTEVLVPLGLESVCFERLDAVRRFTATDSAAATEICSWRGRTLLGEVHDDNAWAMGGVSGHAGLFASAKDVAAFGSAWLGAIDRGGWISSELAQEAVERRPLGRGLGWDMKSVEGSSAGASMGPSSFGHLGFTGCSIWVDPDTKLSIALLSNRVHPSRENDAIRKFRPNFYSFAAKCLLERAVR